MRRADWLGATTKRTLTFLLSTNRTVFVTVLPPIGGIDPPISHPAFPMWFGGKPCLFPPLQESLTPTEPESETEVEEMNLGAVQRQGTLLKLWQSLGFVCFRCYFLFSQWEFRYLGTYREHFLFFLASLSIAKLT